MTASILRAAAACVAALLICPVPAHAKSPPPPVAPLAAGATVELWVRQPGEYGDGFADPRPGLRKVTLAGLRLTEVQRDDVQYGPGRTYRGVPLRELLRQLPAPATADVLLLHFANGMQVPLPLRDDAALRRLDPLVAVSVSAAPGQPFLPLPKTGGQTQADPDARPIVFTGNKLVVGERYHPDVPESAQAVFSPWVFVDTLTGIELIQAAAYARQFDVDPTARPGFALFQQSCQFCHGARKVGARFGWDFVEPIPAYNVRRDDKRLFYHVKYRTHDRGEQMPGLRHLNESDAKQLFVWLKAIANRPMPGYAP